MCRYLFPHRSADKCVEFKTFITIPLKSEFILDRQYFVLLPSNNVKVHAYRKYQSVLILLLFSTASLKIDK